MPDLSVSRQEVLRRQLNKPTPVNGLTPRSPLDFNHEKQKLTVSNSLFQFIIKGNINKVRQLLNRGANINARNDYGFSPLVAALHIENEAKRSKMFRLLMDRGANHKTRDEKYERTVLHWACLLAQLTQVVTLLEESAGDINLLEKDAEGFTALHHAVRVGSVPIVDVLVDYHVKFGITVDSEDKLGLTPFMHARRLGYRDVSSILKEKGLASCGHGDFLFRSPREWSQIGKFERKKAIEIQAQDQVNAAKILGKLQISLNGGPRMAIPGIVVPSYRPSQARRKPPHHISASLPSLGEASTEETQDRPLSTSRVREADETNETQDDMPGAPTVAFTESKSSMKSSPAATVPNNKFSTHDSNGHHTTSSAHTTSQSSIATTRGHMAARTHDPRGGVDPVAVGVHTQPSIHIPTAQLSDSAMSTHRPHVGRPPMRTNSNLAAFSLLEQTSFSKGKLANQFHHSEFDESKKAEYKQMLGNLNSIMDILSQQQTKSFRKSVEIRKPETPPKPKKKSKVSTMAIIFGHGQKRTKRGRSPKLSASKMKGGKGKNQKTSSASTARHSNGSAATSKKSGAGKANKLSVPTIKIN